jgi:hypothetical protein
MPLRLFDDDFRREVSSRGLEAFVETVVEVIVEVIVEAAVASVCCERGSECCGEPIEDILKLNRE